MAGNVLSVSDPNGNTTQFGYNDDQSNRYAFPTSIKNALNQTASTAYDYNIGKPTDSYDVNGAHTQYSYNDPLERLTQMVSPDGAVVNYSYTPIQVDTKRDQNAIGDQVLHTQVRYDGLGRESEMRQYESTSTYISTVTTYDTLGRVATRSNPSRPGDGLGFQTNYLYDALGRAKTVQTADGASSTTTYFGNGALVTDQAGKRRLSFTDAAGRLNQVVEDPTVDANSHKNYATTYTYDALDDLKKVDQSGQIRVFTYDSLRRLKKAENPESGAVTYDYDNAGNLKTRTDGRQVTTTYTYDALNRIKTKTYTNDPSATPGVTFTYDDAAIVNSKGHLTKSDNGISATAYTGFDAAGRITSGTQTIGGKSYLFSYGYNLAGSLLTETYPSGRIVTAGYDGANRANTLTGKSGGTTTPYITQTAYWPHGGVYYFTRGNRVWHAEGYNNRLQLAETYESLDNVNSPANMLFSSCLNWGVNPNYGASLYALCPVSSATSDNGTLQSATFNAGGPQYPQYLSFTQTFGYDSLNRLSSVNDSGGYARTFNYDQWGNMWVTNPSGGPWSGSTPISNIFNNNRMNGVSYDAGGNQLAVNGNALTYDAENRLVSETDGVTGLRQNYIYDGDGQRVQKAVAGGASTTYVYDLFGQLAAEYTTASNTMPCSTCYVAADHLGSTRLLMDQNGAVMARHDYLPFGEEVGAGSGRNSQWNVGNDSLAQKFTGKERDQETGLDYFGARYYGSALGRFTSVDPENAGANPENPQSWNAYSYVLNNPLANIDPFGRECQKLSDDPRGAVRFIGDCSSPEDLAVTQGDKKQVVTVALDRDEAMLVMLASVGQKTTDPRELADVARHGIEMAMMFDSAKGLWDLGAAALKWWRAGAELGNLAGAEAVSEAAGGVAAETKGIVAQNGTRVNGFTTHGINRVIGDGAKRAGTRPEAILDALRNPKKITTGVDLQGRPYQIFTGNNARVVVNPIKGRVVSVNPLSRVGAH